MNRQSNQRGQSLIETILVMPIILLFLFCSIQFSYVTIAKRIQEWASFRMARRLLPLSTENKPTLLPQPLNAELEARSILSKIPFQKSIPILQWEDLSTEVSVSMRQYIFFFGAPYEIKNKITLYR